MNGTGTNGRSSDITRTAPVSAPQEMAENWRTRQDSNLWPLPSEGNRDPVSTGKIGGLQAFSPRNEAGNDGCSTDVARTQAPPVRVTWEDGSSGVLRFTGEEWIVTDREGPPRLTDDEVAAECISMSHGAADAYGDAAGWAYFVGGDAGAIKIGFSLRPAARVKTLQAHSPIPLRILALAPGGPYREIAYHARFAAHRLHGEWFERHPDILAEIERINQETPHAR